MPIPLELDATAFANEDDAQGGEFLAAGTYHVVVDAVEDKFDTHEQINITLLVKAGTTPGQEEKKKVIFFDFREDPESKFGDPEWKSKKSKLQLTQLWMSLGLLKGGASVNCDPTSAVGRECFALFSESKKNDKTGKPFVNYERSFSLDNPEVATVPRGNKEEGMPAAGAAEPVAASAASDDFDDL